MRTLPENYAKNVKILREDLKRGLEPSTGIRAISMMRKQFIKVGLYGTTEVKFINALLEEIEQYTHIHIEEVEL